MTLVVMPDELPVKKLKLIHHVYDLFSDLHNDA